MRTPSGAYIVRPKTLISQHTTTRLSDIPQDNKHTPQHRRFGGGLGGVHSHTQSLQPALTIASTSLPHLCQHTAYNVRLKTFIHNTTYHLASNGNTARYRKHHKIPRTRQYNKKHHEIPSVHIPNLLPATCTIPRLNRDGSCLST
jgi:hypothetical protein